MRNYTENQSSFTNIHRLPCIQLKEEERERKKNNNPEKIYIYTWIHTQYTLVNIYREKNTSRSQRFSQLTQTGHSQTQIWEFKKIPILSKQSPL